MMPNQPFEPEFVAALTTPFEETIAFNRTLGLRIVAITPEQVTGGIDMRCDYLRQVIGERFTLSAEVVRLGSRIASTQMRFMGASGKLLATGAATCVL